MYNKHYRNQATSALLLSCTSDTALPDGSALPRNFSSLVRASVALHAKDGTEGT